MSEWIPSFSKEVKGALQMNQDHSCHSFLLISLDQLYSRSGFFPEYFKNSRPSWLGKIRSRCSALVFDTNLTFQRVVGLRIPQRSEKGTGCGLGGQVQSNAGEEEKPGVFLALLSCEVVCAFFFVFGAGPVHHCLTFNTRRSVLRSYPQNDLETCRSYQVSRTYFLQFAVINIRPHAPKAYTTLPSGHSAEGRYSCGALSLGAHVNLISKTFTGKFWRVALLSHCGIMNSDVLMHF